MFQRDSGSKNAVMRGTVRRIPSALTAIALAVVLSACGGGGGGDEVVPVSILVQPTGGSGVVGGIVRFSVQANGTDLSFQWQRSIDAGSTWGDISGATSSVLELTDVTSDQDGYEFRTRISGKSGSVISSPVTLHVSPAVVPPSFTVNLASPADITEGTDVTMSVTAAGTNLTYLWQSRTDSSSVWTDVPSSNAASLTLKSVSLAANGTQYQVKITNSAADSVTSQIATLTVKQATATPSITTQPQAQSVMEPNPATFVVAGTGNPTPTVQWELSTDNGKTYTKIDGATTSTYTTGATKTTQSGYLYRAVLTNSDRSVTSNPVALTVQAFTEAPKITTAPASVSAAAGSQATFKVEASGTPTPTIKWQTSKDGTSWSDITGANSASYTTPTLTIADVGKVYYRAVANNGIGSAATSAAATLTVTAPPSVLSGKSWRSGSLIKHGTAGIYSYNLSLGISDDGNATVSFIQADGTGRKALQVSSKQLGSGVTESPWDTPVTIDDKAPVYDSYQPILAVSPIGNAVVVWVSQQTCGTDGYGYVGQNYCNYIYTSRRLVGYSAWEAPVKVVASLPDNGWPTPLINDQGDVAILLDGTPGLANTLKIHTAAVALRAGAQNSYRVEYLTGMPLGSLLKVGQHIRAGLDKSGNVTVVGEQINANQTRDIVAYRGTVSNGFGSGPVAEPLENRTADASLYMMQVGLDGHVAAVWKQNTATTNNATLISVRSPQTGTWELHDLTADIGSLGNYYDLRVSDGANGDVSLYNGCTAVRRISGNWQAKQALPANCGLSGGVDGWGMDRNGDYISWSGAQWAAYDATQNVMIKAFPTGTAVAADYVLGVNKSPRNGNAYQTFLMALSPKGYGVSVVTTQYTQMPTASAPNGDYGNLLNLWGFYFR